MVHAEKDIKINQPIKDVFEFLADGLNNRKWRSTVAQISLRSGESGTPGAVYNQFLKGPMNGKIPADYKITSVERNKSIRFSVVTGPVKPDGEFTVHEVSGGTKVHFGLSCELHGPAKLLEHTVVKSLQAEVNCLTELKRILEGVI